MPPLVGEDSELEEIEKPHEENSPSNMELVLQFVSPIRVFLLGRGGCGVLYVLEGSRYCIN